MITLVNQFAADIEDKKGSITEDEVWYNGGVPYCLFLTDNSIQVYSTECRDS